MICIHKHTPTHRHKRSDTIDQKYVRISTYMCGRKPEYPKKTTKVGMESANKIHIQPPASCIGQRKEPESPLEAIPDTERIRH